MPGGHRPACAKPMSQPGQVAPEGQGVTSTAEMDWEMSEPEVVMAAAPQVLLSPVDCVHGSSGTTEAVP